MASVLLNWHVLLAICSAALSLAAGILYVADILKGGETRPNAVSFFLWTVLQTIALVGQVQAGASWSVVVALFFTLNTGAVTVLALSGYGYRTYGLPDLFCFVIAMGAAYLLASGSPAHAILLSIIGDFSAFIPTYLKTFKEPASEHLLAWILVTLSALFGALATSRLDFANLAFPLYSVVGNGLVIAFVWGGRARLAHVKVRV